MSKHADTTRSLEAKSRARAVISRRVARNSCGNLNDGVDAIGARKGCRVLPSDDGHILEPTAGFGINDTQRLHPHRIGHVDTCYIEAAIAWIVPYLITATHLLNDVEGVDFAGVRIQRQDDREATRRNENMLVRAYDQSSCADTGQVCECLAVERVSFFGHHTRGVDDLNGGGSYDCTVSYFSRHGDEEPSGFGVPDRLLQTPGTRKCYVAENIVR